MLTAIKEILNTKTNNIFHKYIYFSAILSIFLYFNLGSIFLFIGLSILLINICIYLISIFLPNKK